MTFSNLHPTASDTIDRGVDMPGFGLRMHFAQGEEIFAQEEEADLVYQILQGAVRTTRLLNDGRRQIGDFYYPGDLLGLEIGQHHRFSGEALEACEILVVKRAAIKNLGEEGQRFERQISAATGLELERTQEHLLLLGRKTAAERVAGFLVDIADRFGGEYTGLPMGRQDMADYLGLTIETVSRMLTQLQADGLVEFDGCRRFRLKNRRAMALLAEN